MTSTMSVKRLVYGVTDEEALEGEESTRFFATQRRAYKAAHTIANINHLACVIKCYHVARMSPRALFCAMLNRTGWAQKVTVLATVQPRKRKRK